MSKYLAQTAKMKFLEDLTVTEFNVMILLVSGLSYVEIAKKQYVSLGTIHKQTAAIRRKFGLRDRVHIVIFCYENDLVPPGLNSKFKFNGKENRNDL